MKLSQQNQTGHSLLAFLLLLIIATILIGVSLTVARNALRNTSTSKEIIFNSYESEDSSHRVLSWFREHSDDMSNIFSRNEFYNNFRHSTASLAGNDTALPVATTIKNLSNQNIILTSDNSLGTSNFPLTSNINNGASFNSNTIFSSANLGDALIKVTLIGVIPVTPSKDYGPPPNPTPGTDFSPVYQIDTLTSLDAGAHHRTIFIGEFDSTSSIGFYGHKTAKIDATCDSYNSTVGPYSNSNKQADCSVGSNSYAEVGNKGVVYGSVKSNGTISIKGDVCANFNNGCPDSGETCSGTSCQVQGIAPIDPWNVLCPTDQGNLNITTDTTLSIASDNPTDKCWDEIRIAKDTTLTLTTTSYSYFINSLRRDNHSTSRILISPDNQDAKVTLYINDIQGNKSISGSTFINSDPKHFLIYYLDNNTISLIDNTNIALQLIAPNARVHLNDNFHFYGAIYAEDLDVNNKPTLHYDESLGIDTGAGMTYRMNEINSIPR